MRVKINIFILCLIFTSLALCRAYAEDTSLENIFNFPEEFNRKEVQIEGEVIGEPMNDDQGFWFNISAGPYQIGVFSSGKEPIEAITHWGSYAATGDQVRVKGVFYEKCPVYQVSCLYLSSLEVIREGHDNEYEVSAEKQRLAKLLSAICLLIAFIYLIKLKYGKRD